MTGKLTLEKREAQDIVWEDHEDWEKVEKKLITPVDGLTTIPVFLNTSPQKNIMKHIGV